MTATNPHPLANPLNRQRYTMYEMQKPMKPISHCNDPSKLEVPQSSVTYEQALEMQKSLTVPYSAPDDLGATKPCSFGFIGKSSLFMLHDGSVLDLKSHKIVLDPNIKFKAAGYWNDPNETTTTPYESEWHKPETLESLLASYDDQNGNYDPNLSPESIRYWKKAQEESKKLEQNMTDEQKDLIKKLESGEFFPMTRLEDDL